LSPLNKTDDISHYLLVMFKIQVQLPPPHRPYSKLAT